MVLIPNDIGVRMRMQAEASLLQPASPVAEIPADLIQLRIGQKFLARIQEVLPENTYKALVAGKSITLALPEGAEAGDTLELVVIDRSPRVIVAQLAAKTTSPEIGPEAGQSYQFTTLSSSGRLIGSLLLPQGETPAPAELNRGQPVIAQAPTSAKELAVALGKAIQKSGLFYESHQAKWITGQVTLASLLQEPQGRHSVPATFMANASMTENPPALIPKKWIALSNEIADLRQEPASRSLSFATLTTTTSERGGVPEGNPQNRIANPTTTDASLDGSEGNHSVLQPSTEVPDTQVFKLVSSAAAVTQEATPEVNSQYQIADPTTTDVGLDASKGHHSTSQPLPENPGAKVSAAEPGIENLALTKQTGASPFDSMHPEATRAESPPRQQFESFRAAVGSIGGDKVVAQTNAIPDDLRPLVQQQLDSLATQRLVWHGEVWPDQKLDWEIDWQQGRGNGNSEEANQWATTLRLTTPRLGEVDVRIQLNDAGVRLLIASPSNDSANDLRDALPKLEQALNAAGVPLLGALVKHDAPSTNAG